MEIIIFMRVFRTIVVSFVKSKQGADKNKTMLISKVTTCC